VGYNTVADIMGLFLVI